MIDSRKRRRSPSPDPKIRAVEQVDIKEEPRTSEHIDRKRKRLSGIEGSISPPHDQPSEQPAVSLADCAVAEQSLPNDTNTKVGDPIFHWIQQGSWPKGYSKQNINMSLPLARKRSFDFLGRKASEDASVTPSDQKPREEKSAPYTTPQYRLELAAQGSYMNESKLGISDASKTDYKTLFETEQTVPDGTLFHGDQFTTTIRKIGDRNEARVVQDISRLIVPSAETLATQGAIDLENLIENVNEGWNNAIPVAGPRPQPDYSVGFASSAFTSEQFKKLQPFVGGWTYTSFFRATWRTYFPFFTCEVKCGAGALDVADRQNAHSMTLAVRGIVELFKLVKREEELHRKILAFSVSHNDRSVRIYGHYPIIDGQTATFYSHPIRDFSFLDEDGKERWTTYRFTKNLYEKFMPELHKSICSAIDDLPADLNFEISLGGSTTPSAVAQSESAPSKPSETATNPPSSQGAGNFKKPRLPPKVMLQQENDQLREQINQFQNSTKQENDHWRELISQFQSSAKQETDRLKEQIDQLMALLKQQTAAKE